MPGLRRARPDLKRTLGIPFHRHISIIIVSISFVILTRLIAFEQQKTQYAYGSIARLSIGQTTPWPSLHLLASFGLRQEISAFLGPAITTQSCREGDNRTKLSSLSLPPPPLFLSLSPQQSCHILVVIVCVFSPSASILCSHFGSVVACRPLVTLALSAALGEFDDRLPSSTHTSFAEQTPKHIALYMVTACGEQLSRWS